LRFSKSLTTISILYTSRAQSHPLLRWTCHTNWHQAQPNCKSHKQIGNPFWVLCHDTKLSTTSNLCAFYTTMCPNKSVITTYSPIINRSMWFTFYY